jgi:hypothetical protein
MFISDNPCGKCGGPIIVRTRPRAESSRFCSRKCRHATETKTKVKISRPCVWCAKPVHRVAARMTQRGSLNAYCDAKCVAWSRSYKAALVATRKTVRRRTKEDSARLAAIFGGACAVCGFSRFLNYAHVEPKRTGGKATVDNIIPLCPNHHALFDRSELEPDELRCVERFVNPRQRTAPP